MSIGSPHIRDFSAVTEDLLLKPQTYWLGYDIRAFGTPPVDYGYMAWLTREFTAVRTMRLRAITGSRITTGRHVPFFEDPTGHFWLAIIPGTTPVQTNASTDGTSIVVNQQFPLYNLVRLSADGAAFEVDVSLGNPFDIVGAENGPLYSAYERFSSRECPNIGVDPAGDIYVARKNGLTRHDRKTGIAGAIIGWPVIPLYGAPWGYATQGPQNTCFALPAGAYRFCSWIWGKWGSLLIVEKWTGELDTCGIGVPVDAFDPPHDSAHVFEYWFRSWKTGTWSLLRTTTKLNSAPASQRPERPFGFSHNPHMEDDGVDVGIVAEDVWYGSDLNPAGTALFLVTMSGGFEDHVPSGFTFAAFRHGAGMQKKYALLAANDGTIKNIRYNWVTNLVEAVNERTSGVGSYLSYSPIHPKRNYAVPVQKWRGPA